jgi:NAD(P)-dependent dehydrogenase (short-subunit alcohol dehydrogenase family)
MEAEWSPAAMPDLTGKVMIVTGANTGIGMWTISFMIELMNIMPGRVKAQYLAKKGAHVIFACRSLSKTQPVIDQMKTDTGNQKLEFMELNLLSLKSVDAFADKFIERKLPLHALILNAGIMATPFTLSEDCIESQFATNHVAVSF